MRSSRAITLVEVLVSLALIALIAGSLMVIYAAVLAGSRKSDVNQDAVAALDTLRDTWEIRARETWPTTPAPDRVVRYTGCTYNDYVYDVDDLGRIENPLQSGAYLEMKRVRLLMQFKDEDSRGQEITRSYETVFHVVK
ncbi:MAG: type II secretion system protein [Candidatus Eremiobacterota bacterium]